MNFITAIKLYFKNYVKFSGRSSRPEFWWPVLMNILVLFSCIAVIALTEPFSDDLTQSVYMVIPAIWNLGNILPILAVGVRRLHDIDKSWVWILLALIPSILVYLFPHVVSIWPHIIDKLWIWFPINLIKEGCMIWFIVMMALPGNPEANKYGPAPMQ